MSAVCSIPTTSSSYSSAEVPLVILKIGENFASQQNVMRKLEISYETFLTSYYGIVICQCDSRGTSGREYEYETTIAKGSGLTLFAQDQSFFLKSLIQKFQSVNYGIIASGEGAWIGLKVLQQFAAANNNDIGAEEGVQGAKILGIFEDSLVDWNSDSSFKSEKWIGLEFQTEQEEQEEEEQEEQEQQMGILQGISNFKGKNDNFSFFIMNGRQQQQQQQQQQLTVDPSNTIELTKQLIRNGIHFTQRTYQNSGGVGVRRRSREEEEEDWN